MAKKKGGSKKQFNLNGLLYVLIFITSLGILYMLWEEKINSFFEKEPTKQEQIQEQTPQVSDNVSHDYDKSWYLNSISQYKNYDLKFEYFINVNSPIEQVAIRLPLPQHQKNWQYIFANNYDKDNYSLSEEDGNKFVNFELINPELKQYKIELQTEVAVRNYDINTAKQINRNLRPEINIDRYLQAEENIEVNSEYLKQIADGIQGITKEEIVRNIYDFVQKNLEYTTKVSTINAEQVIKTRKAFCSGFSSLMVTLCRIKGIPARVVYGNIIKNGKESKHNWVEVYYSEYGWVMYDPVFFVYTHDKKFKSQKDEIISPIYDYVVLGYNKFDGWSVYMTSQNVINNPISIDDNFIVIEK